MRFKKLSALVLAGALSFSLVACSGGGTTTTPAPQGGGTPATTPVEPTANDLKVDVFIYNYADTYIASVRDAMKTAFEAQGLTEADNFTFYDGANTQSTQTQQIETAVSQGSDLLIVNIVTTGSDEAAMNVVNLAKEKDIPVIFFNREVSNDVVNAYEKCAFVGTDADEAGYMQGEMIADILLADYDAMDLNGDGVISYIMFKGELGNAEADGRTQYSVEEANRLLADAGKPALAYYDANNTDLFQACDWDTAKAQNAMATALGTNKLDGADPIELVIANNDGMAIGAVTALNEVGYNTGDGPSIPVVGVDATTEAQDAIAAGKMSGTIKQDAVGMAEGIVKLAMNVSGGSDLMAGTEGMNVDSDAAKIRIPYAKFTG